MSSNISNISISDYSDKIIIDFTKEIIHSIEFLNNINVPKLYMHSYIPKLRIHFQNNIILSIISNPNDNYMYETALMNDTSMIYGIYDYDNIKVFDSVKELDEEILRIKMLTELEN